MIKMIAVVLGLWPGLVWAEMVVVPGQALLRGATGGLLRTGTPLIAARASGATGSGGSLFTGQSIGGLFAPLPKHTREAVVAAPLALRGTPVERIRQLIQYAESRRDGYDAVQHGAVIKPRKAPTRMTIGEINRWIDDTPGQPHAIGRYQFIPPTLRSLIKRLGLPDSTRFSPDIQDRLADVLLIEAGLNSVRSGAMKRETFMHNLAKIWAGFPTANGRSYYHGYAGNKSSITWAQYDAEMRRIFRS